MDLSEFSEHECPWPRFGLIQINENLVITTSYISKKQMKVHKSSETHNYVTSGQVKMSVTKRVSRMRTLAVFEVKLIFD